MVGRAGAAVDADGLACAGVQRPSLPHALVVEEGAVVEIAGPIVISEDTAISGSGTLRLSSSWNSTEPVFTILPGATLTIDGVTLDGNDAAGVKLQGVGASPGYDGAEDAAFILCKGNLCMKSGSIENVNSAEKGMRGGIIVLASGSSSFEMSGGEIKNNRFTGGPDGGFAHGIVTAKAGSTFTMSGGSIHHNSFKDDGDEDWSNGEPQGGNYLSGVVNLESGAKMEMSGDASIAYNDITGVVVGEVSHGDDTEFVMNGGSIHHNDLNAGRNMFMVYGQNWEWAVDRGWLFGNAIGGGVKIRSGSFIMNDGSIHHNNALFGGGVATFQSFGDTGTFLMNGGTISENTSYVGGGIYVSGGENSTADVHIVGGRIEKNNAVSQGGGIYVANPFTAHLENVVVYENDASLMGGGIWSCPTADVRNFITNGGAIYNNTAGSPDDNAKAGADIASVPKNSGHAMYLANRILGGGQTEYYRDGQITDNGDLGQEGRNVLGSVTPDSARFDPSNPGEPDGGGLTTSKDPTALNSEPAENAIALAEAKAKVIITQNTSERGGGIGTNGSIIIGSVPDPDDPSSGEYTLMVEKVWSGFKSDGEYSATVALVVTYEGTEYMLDTVTLTPEQPTGSFTGLGEGEYSVRELDVPDKVHVTYEVSGSNGMVATLGPNSREATIKVTNTYVTPTPTPTSAPTHTPAPTPTQSPTRTPEPTHSPQPTQTPPPTPSPRPTPQDDPRYPFTFTKRWSGWQQNKPEKEISWTLYRPDGTVYNHKFNGKQSGMTWTYRASLSVDGCYLIEKPIPGYTTTYVNVGTYAQVTDRCYTGGTIINSPIPRTGDSTPVLPILGAMALSALCTTTLAFSRRKEEHQ